MPTVGDPPNLSAPFPLRNGAILDGHLHTVRGAADSELQPLDLLREARRLGLTALNISEHDRVWEQQEWQAFTEQAHGLFLSRGMEVSTDLGHVVVFGIDRYHAGIRSCERLRRVADEIGAFISVAHPFRHFFDPITFRRRGEEPFALSPAEAAERMPVFRFVHGIEVANGGNTTRENAFAYRVAAILGKPMTAGSDAHSRSGIGACATAFPQPLRDREHLLALLHAGRSTPLVAGDGGFRAFRPPD